MIKKNVEKVKSTLKNSTENKKILNLNEKDKDRFYPLLKAIYEDNIEIVQLLIEYANRHKIILKLNGKNKYGYYPLLEATFKNNIVIVQLLLEYCNSSIITGICQSTSNYFGIE